MTIKTIKRNGIIFSFINGEEFEAIYKDIFIRKEYPFRTIINSPIILDCGAHIGLATLYFKKLYPNARITDFEPNPRCFELLTKNVKQNNLQNVELINAAISDKEGEIDFYVEKDVCNPWGWGDSAVINKWYSKEKDKTIKVKSLRLSSFIKNEIDLVKLDIEGLEQTILKEIEKKLTLVKEIIMEFHGSSTNPSNNSSEILSLLRKNSFACKINQDGKFIEEMDVKKTDPYWLMIYAKNLKIHSSIYKTGSIDPIPAAPDQNLAI